MPEVLMTTTTRKTAVEPERATSVEVERVLNTGIRNLWYPVAASWMVGSRPVGMTRLGEQIVLWRDRAGSVRALRDRCPHRGARLSLGWNFGDRLACWYHGVEVSGDGVVTAVPAVASCPLQGKSLVRSYPAQERNGAIFLWFGDQPEAAPLPLTLPDELASGEFSAFLCTAHWKCNYRYAAENIMDPMHGTYLHAQSHSMARGDRSAEMRVRRIEHGFVFEKTTQRDVNLDWSEFGNTGTHWLRVSIPYRKDAGPGGNFSIVAILTPVDERNCRMFAWRLRKVSGWQRDAWRFLYRSRLEGLHWDVLEQDRIVLEEMASDAREHENLYQHDVGVAWLRRFLRQAAEEIVRVRRAQQRQPN
jgi:phenylpropionate dioxygenase-like ring-hydroxylating dioxygenase large terminal subunit